jgi:glycine oxidase
VPTVRDRDEAEALERELEMRRGLGLEVERLRPSAARELEPGLAPTLRLALRIASDHNVDPRRLTAALAAAAQSAGASIRPRAEVEALERSAEGLHGLRLAGGELVRAEQVVIAAGPWSASIEGVPAEVRVPVRPVKGQTIRLRDRAGPGLVTHVIRTQTGYLVPRGDGRYVLGATMEERGFDRHPTAGAVGELLSDVTELVPGVSELVIEELAVGLRPVTPDNRPVIGPAAVAQCKPATGHHRHGVLLAPLTAEFTVSALTGDEDPRAAPFSPARFAQLMPAARR